MNVTEIRAEVGVRFIVALEANPTTGYTWEATFDRNVVELKEKSFEPYAPDAIGGGGREQFIFIPKVATETDVILRYRRPWQRKIADERRFRIIISKGNPGCPRT